ncbi:MAG: orotate phosphoribosyltransferase [bacterium]|nr:orotate phosphoribosyltransferase [bacterium]
MTTKVGTCTLGKENPTVDRKELATAIKDAAYLEGDFVLRSGKRSKYYIDKYRFETKPHILSELGRCFAEYVGSETTLIAGAELGGVALAAATSLATGLPFIIVRNAKKDYGTSNLFEGVLEKGACVLIVEDVATTGGQVLEAAKAITESGGRVERIVAVLDRLQGARENIEAAGVVFDALLTSADLGIRQT